MAVSKIFVFDFSGRSITSFAWIPCEQRANKRCPKPTKTALFRACANS